MAEMPIVDLTIDESKPLSQSGQDAINIINEYMTEGSTLNNKMLAAVALALLDVADAIRNKG
jgi:hypothetical protein